ncbi:hypothetical protein SUGI_0196660 [Cryptomeria japonica]|uniref:UDP-glucosyltransferase 29-like n=1 Tax=Cryptomeria japonica TaxID=3369 RepID=UPI002408E2CD|nr:UDP-glucosyltransferase 29-like [Cryptomeria japonica]GLJ12730.1 hypothetical protein SUGI_0196660 [Cryptomeria japonica]
MENDKQIHIAMFPWLAHGHISPYLELSNRLVHAGLKVSLISTGLNISRIRESADKLVQLVAIPLPAIEGLPGEIENTADLPLDLMPLFEKAMDGLEKPFQQIIRQIRPNCVVFDFFQWWTPRAVAAAQFGTPTIFFQTCGAAFSGYSIHPAWRGHGKEITAHDLTIPPPDYPSSVISWKLFEAETVIGCYKPQNPGGISFLERGLKCYEDCTAMAIKTCDEIEGSFVEYLQKKVVCKRVVPVGPLVALIAQSKIRASACLAWLEKQAPCSVVYVAFGSHSFLSSDQVKEIALGLESSCLSFLWALRLPHGRAMKDVLPEGFKDRVEGRGFVTGDWVAQREILSHPSTGAFLTHCGWNSVMEGLSCGLPFIALPIMLDQAINARLLCEHLLVGFDVGRTEDGSLCREEICRAARMVMDEEQGRDFRLNARQMGEVFRFKIVGSEEGIPLQELYINNFIALLLQLTGNSQIASPSQTTE